MLNVVLVLPVVQRAVDVRYIYAGLSKHGSEQPYKARF